MDKLQSKIRRREDILERSGAKCDLCKDVLNMLKDDERTREDIICYCEQELNKHQNIIETTGI